MRYLTIVLLITFSLPLMAQFDSLEDTELSMLKISDVKLFGEKPGASIIYGVTTGNMQNGALTHSWSNTPFLTNKNYWTVVDYKVSENLNYHIIVAPIWSSEGKNIDSVDIIFTKYSYGQDSGIIKERVKKHRWLVEGLNSFIETARLSNGFVFIIEEHIKLISTQTANMNKIFFDDYSFP